MSHLDGNGWDILGIAEELRPACRFKRTGAEQS
jgi:hypothetical protein